ncbi:alpha/beta hydrolase [Culicoidibacter larvae]|uniref:Serine aminopeptidase S33 domain-containing protein n=1 Tax=Culicoidibacter larvae TaxID=2579976 RepID=A0A5R8QFL6_9FIRM|nr:hypothetical protein [Culicoidibacter larvae]TLG76772.1 hypothetical protein FEZ08_03915 [Culicoidibacter larvae]
MERAIECRYNGHILRGMLHLPEAAALKNVPAVIIFHSLLNDARGSHRTLVKMSRELAARGIACVRFDFLDFGDSDDFANYADLQEVLGQAMAILEHTEKYPWLNGVYLCGCGASGLVAASLANAVPERVKKLLLYGPTKLKLPRFRLKDKLEPELLAEASTLLDVEQPYGGPVYLCLTQADELGNRLSEQVLTDYYQQNIKEIDHVHQFEHLQNDERVQQMVFVNMAEFILKK